MTPPDSADLRPKPTLFLSYASEDRAAARRLRDTLAAAGIEVWYDENELTGGDAWDAKIRRQIRECDYFMPLISANTERRKEGYFRREWRLATERTLDMADDVMFLLPVCLDDTTELNARVPEKFLSFQWLRSPGGESTPALEALARRVARGDHSVSPPPRVSEPFRPTSAPPPASRGSHAPRHDHDPADGPPPMPAFPKQHGQDLGDIVKFFAEVAWWVITAVWILFRRAPKWVRILVIIWIVMSATASLCSRADRSDKADPAPAAAPEKPRKTTERKLTPADLQAGLAEATKALKESGLPQAWAQFGTEVAQRLANELKDSEAADKQLVAVPFAAGIADPADAKYLEEVFTPLWGRLSIARSGQTALIATPLASPSDDTLAALGRKLDATYLLGARLLRPADGSPATLEVALVRGADGTVAWTARYPVEVASASALGGQIADALLAATAAPAK